MVEPLSGWLVGWLLGLVGLVGLVGLAVDWLGGWLDGWLVDWLSH